MSGASLLILAAGMGSRYGGLKQMDPVGPAGEIVLDYSIFDAIRAGFGEVVFVIRRDIEEAFREVVARKWEQRIPCRYVFQELSDVPAGTMGWAERTKPWGTAHAIRSARKVLTGPFAAINADDFYGEDSFRTLAGHLGASTTDEHCMVAFQLGQTLSENGSVSRGVCLQNTTGHLEGIREYTKITREADGAIWNRPDSGTPAQLTGQEPVSMNCWGFQPSFFEELETGFMDFLRNGGATAAKAEYTIPEVVDRGIRSGRGGVKVLKTTSRWFGVTYRADKPQVQASIRALVNEGIYPEKL